MQHKRKIKKVLLIQPPFTIERTIPKGAQPPLGLAYIAAILEQNGYIVNIIDAIVEGFDSDAKVDEKRIRYGLSFNELKERIRKSSPDLVGVSCPFTIQLNNANKVCKITKEVNPKIFTVMGGAHPTNMPKKVLEDKAIDIVAIGEADYTFLEIIKAIEKGKTFDHIDGIAFRSNKKIKINPKTKYIENLDELPFPARHLLHMKKYFRLNKPHGISYRKSPNTSIITSRGCPSNCIFCSIHTIWGRKFRARSPENVIAEIRHLVNTYGIKELQFEDDNLTVDRKRAEKIFQGMVREKFNLLWSTPNCVAAWALDESLLRLMKKSGCYRIIFGFESGSNYVLKNIINKPQKIENIKPLIKKAQKLGIEVGGFFVVGFPGETREQIKQTFRFARNSNLDYAGISIATPHPGTRLWDQCIEEGYLKKDFNLNRLFARNANIETDQFTSKELQKEVAKENLLFYLAFLVKRPVRFFKIIFGRFILNDPTFFYRFAKEQFNSLIKRS